MDTKTLQLAILAALPDAEISLEGEGCNFTAAVASALFEGLAPVKRQQLGLESLKSRLESGELHAISLKTYTLRELEQARARNAASLASLG